MPIKCTTPKDLPGRMINEETRRYQQVLFNELAMIGELVINFARSSDRERYTDQTGNLTSSLRYCIVVDGQIVNMPELGFVLKGYEGREESKRYLEEIASGEKRGMQLIFVAGMPYAAYVERIAGKHVLDRPEEYARQLFKAMMKKFSKASKGKQK